MEDILINPETTYTIIATGQKDKDYYEKYIDNNIANDFDRVVEFIGYFENVYAIARQKAAEIDSADGMSKEDAGSKTAEIEERKRQIKAELQKVETVVAPLLTKLRDIEREYLESSKNPENSGKTPKQRNDAFNKHSNLVGEEKGWFKLENLKNLNYDNIPDDEVSNVFNKKLFNTEHPEKSDKYISLNKYFLSRSVPGDGFCLIKSIETLTGQNYKYIAQPQGNANDRVLQAETLKKRVPEGVSTTIPLTLTGEIPWDTELNLEETGNKKGEFNTLSQQWIYLMAVLEQKRIFVFVDNSNYPQNHLIIYPTEDEEEKKKYKTFDNTLFILNKGGHYYPLKLKKSVNKKPSFLSQFKNNNPSLGWQNSTTFSYRDEDYQVNPPTTGQTAAPQVAPAAPPAPPAPPAPILPATNPLGALGGESKRGNPEPTNLVSKEDDPPNPSRVPILRKAIKKNIKQKKNVKSLVETLRCTVDDEGELQCDDPLKVSKWTYHGKHVNRINYGDSKDNNKSPVAPEIPDNPFKKASDENWIQTNVLNHPDYSKTKEKFDNYVKFLIDKKLFDVSSRSELSDMKYLRKWYKNSITAPDIHKFFNIGLKKKDYYRYKKILSINWNQILVDMDGRFQGKLRILAPNEQNYYTEIAQKVLKTNLQNGESILFNWVYDTEKKPSRAYEHIARMVMIVIFFEFSQFAITYVQGDDSLLNHILQFTFKILQNESIPDNEIIYIYYFLLRNIFYAKYPLKRPSHTDTITEDNKIGISFTDIIDTNDKHFLYRNSELANSLKMEDSQFYDLSKPKIIHLIFVSLILKKHRDIFSNIFLSHPNVLRFLFNTLNKTIALLLYDMGGKNKKDIDKIKRESNKLINFGIMGNTDLNILKNIYGNFLKNHNILSLLTTFYISFTAQLPENDYTFNNIPFVTAVRDALPQNIDLGLEIKKNDVLKINEFAERLQFIFSPNATFAMLNYNENQYRLINKSLLVSEKFIDENKLKQWGKDVVDLKTSCSLVGYNDINKWSYTTDAINDYNVIIKFFNGNEFDKLLTYFFERTSNITDMPNCPIDFILYDNSLWNIPYEETWQESKYISYPNIPKLNILNEIDNDSDDDNNGSESKGSSKTCGDVKMLKDSCPRKGDWVTKLCDPEKIQNTIDALERCIKKYRKYDTDDAKKKVAFSEAQLRYLKKKLRLLRIEEGKDPFELTEADQLRINNMTPEEKEASSKEIEILFGPHPLSTCDETKECKFTPEEEAELLALEAEVAEDETPPPEEEADAAAEEELRALEAELETEEKAQEAIPPKLAMAITEMKTLIKRQKKSLLEGKNKTRKYIRISKNKKKDNKTRKRHETFAAIINRRNKQLKNIIIQNVKSLNLLKKTARDIVEAQKANASKSIENPVHEGGGKLSRGQLADYRLKHIQKLLNKQKKNKTLKKFNRRLNKTIKLY